MTPPPDPMPTELMLGDLQAAIHDYEQALPRSQQKEIGPSEVGTRCSRRLLMQILGAETVNTDRDQWPATVGTAVHTLLADAFTLANERLTAAGLPPRWLIEQEIQIRPGMKGHTDLVDLWTWTIIDHKNVSVANLRKARAAGHPGQQYEAQAHLYGLGWARAGLPVTKVAIAFYPKSGLMRDSWLWTADYDQSIAQAALDRMDNLLADANEAELKGDLDQYLWALPRDTDYCTWCPFWTAGAEAPSETPATHCAGEFETPGHVAKAKARVPGLVS